LVKTPRNSKYKVLHEQVKKCVRGHGDKFTHILKLLLDGMSVNIS